MNDTTYIVVDRDDGCELEIVASSVFEAARKFVCKGDYEADPDDCHTVTVRLRVREQGADEDDWSYISVEVPPPMAEYPAADESSEDSQGHVSLGYYDRAQAERCAEAAQRNLDLYIRRHGFDPGCRDVGKVEIVERRGVTSYWVRVVYP